MATGTNYDHRLFDRLKLVLFKVNSLIFIEKSNLHILYIKLDKYIHVTNLT